MSEREGNRPSIERAQEGLEAARVCLEQDLLHSSTSRAYYAMFWAAQVALADIGVTDSEWSHRALLVKRRKRYPSRFGAQFNETLLLRLDADYRLKGVSRRQATRAIRYAREFVTRIAEETSHDTATPDGS